jgi:hypothetical protein
MKDNTLFGKCIRTFKGNLLCCMEINGKNFFFAMDKIGMRFFFKHELERGKYLNIKEWEHALATWDNAKEEILVGEELAYARTLAPLIANDFTFNMSRKQIAGLPADHMKRFY